MPPAIPIATYRVQLTANFDFDAAVSIVPYLKALGITHLYASPFMKARKGSTHGYDIVDHTRINPELGGDAGFERLSQALKQHDLGLILDFVPNHVGVMGWSQGGYISAFLTAASTKFAAVSVGATNAAGASTVEAWRGRAAESVRTIVEPGLARAEPGRKMSRRR